MFDIERAVKFDTPPTDKERQEALALAALMEMEVWYNTLTVSELLDEIGPRQMVAAFIGSSGTHIQVAVGVTFVTIDFDEVFPPSPYENFPPSPYK